MEKTDKKYGTYVQILKEELVPAMGCTEPIAIAYAAAKAREILGTLPDKVEIGVSGISMMTGDREMVLQKTGVCRGQYMFAQANSLALAVIDAPAALTGVANVKYKIPVTVGATLVARAEVVRKQEDKYTIWVKIRNNHREVFRAKFLIVAIPEQRSQEDENRS